MPSRPLFTVVIPTFNRRELIKQCLASVWRQNFSDYEVIVIDDGSTDGTWEYLQTERDRVTSIRQANGGPGKARNLGAKHAQGDYLAFLDSDDLWFDWTLQTFAKILSEHPELSSLCGRLKPFSSFGDHGRVATSDIDFHHFENYLEAAGQGCYAGAGMVAVKTSSFRKANGFCTTIHNSEDHDLMLRLGDDPGFAAIKLPFTVHRRVQSDSLAENPKHLFLGIMHLIRQEQSGAYPGGTGMARNRRYIISQHARSMSNQLLTAGQAKAAWRVYRSTLAWQLRLKRYKYSLAFPLKFLWKAVRSLAC